MTSNFLDCMKPIRTTFSWVLSVSLVICFTTITSGIAANYSAFSLQSSELPSISVKNVFGQIDTKQLDKWDEIILNLTLKQPIQNGGEQRLFAYLYHAQMAFMEASKQMNGIYLGSIDPISLGVIQLFYPNYDTKIVTDPFSNQLAALLMQKITSRFREESAGMHPIKIEEHQYSWRGPQPSIGIEVPTLKPWSLKTADEFRLPSPPGPQDKFWMKQLDTVKLSVENATESQKKKLLFWAGETFPGSGDFISIANYYLSVLEVPLEKRVQVRLLVASAMVDSMITAFDSKYVYLVRRPFMLDKSLKPYIPTPNHPSYPSIHSVSSSALSLIMSFCFPENQFEWGNLAQECGMSRIWAGVHFPIDHEAGKALGTKVGEMTLTRQLPTQ